MTNAKTMQNASGQHKKFEIVSGSAAIAPYIGIRPPDDASKSPPVLSFRRKREVDIPWMTILSGGAGVRGCAKSVEAIRSYFETSWGFDEPDSLKKWMAEKNGEQRKNELLGNNDARREETAYCGWVKRIASAHQCLAEFSSSAANAIEDIKRQFGDLRVRLAKAEFGPNVAASVAADITAELMPKLSGARDAVRSAPRYISAIVERVAETVSDLSAVLSIRDSKTELMKQATEKVSTALSLISADAPRTPVVYRAQLDPAKDAKDILVSAGYIIRHGSSRLYLLIDSNENPLRDDDFLSYEKYRKAWEDKILGIELVFESPADAKNCFMDVEEIDMQPPFIQRSYQRLKLRLDFARKVSDDVAKRVGKMIEKLNEAAISPEEIEQLQNQVLKLEIGVFDIEKQIRRMASIAERLGYFLCIGSLAGESPLDAKTTAIQAFNSSMQSLLQKDVETAKSKTDLATISAALIKLAEYENMKQAFLVNADSKFGGTPFESPPEPGKIYTTYQRTAKWNVLVPTQVPVQVGAWFWRHTVQRTVEVARPLEAVVTRRKEVDVNKDMVEAKRTELARTGLQVYVFKKTPTGFMSEDGVPLHQIMDRCNFDEMFRRQCAVMLPVYRESMTGQRLLTRYLVFKRPMPGIVPTIMPRLSLEESLSYRTAWLQTELGEMVSSINLAPGEERQVKISKSYEQETTVARTSNSIFDVTSTESTDLASEMENQARHEQESSKSMEFSAKASGSYLGFSAEASASGGTKSSLKDTNQAISKVAKKAAQSVSSHNRQEVNSSSTARAKITNVDETTATIRNINQGRSLNLFFYRLYNKYKGGLYLENLRFDVIQSVEVIAGSGVHESRSYGLDQLPEMVAEFKSAHLPFAISDTSLYTCHLLDSIETLLRDEYMNLKVFDSGKLKPAFAPTTASAKEAEALAEQKLDHLHDALRAAVIHSNVPIAPQELLVAAPGLYLDAAVGAQPSTEQYSEDMRKQEVRMRQAEVFVKESEGFSNQAKAAAQLAQMQSETANCITGVLPDPGLLSLTLSLRLPLPAGDWSLVIKDGNREEEKTQAGANSAGQYMIHFTWRDRQQWLGEEGLTSRITLVNRLSRDRIAHLSALQIKGEQP